MEARQHEGQAARARPSRPSRSPRALGGAAIAAAAGGGGDDDATDTPITGRRSTARARPRSTHTGGGKVTGTEAGDEEGAYEVEVTRADGSQVDVHLDADFNVIGQEDDGDDD